VQKADICLFLEGTYPYYTGGVSKWAHDLICAHSNYTFYLVMIMPQKKKLPYKYEIPSNVVGMQNVFLHSLPLGKTVLTKKRREQFFDSLEEPFAKLLYEPSLEDLYHIIRTLKSVGPDIGADLLLNSEEAWQLLVRTYKSSIASTSFLNFFWSYRNLMGGLYSILLAPLPTAELYHSFCTGFAGIFLARARVETQKPCLVTEHGIYTNERRIEISSAEWLDDEKSMDLTIDLSTIERDLKDYWISNFSCYSQLCYQACDRVITLYEGNQTFQIEDGADPSKMMVIPNGIDYDFFSNLPRDDNHIPTVALIGRVVPIKDIKTFIRAIDYLKGYVDKLRAWIIGPCDEDPDYFKECQELVSMYQLDGVLTFTGKVNIDEYLPEIDLLALTSISESQPLVILEAGAAGIPTVATNVGSCRELIYGRSNEEPKLGPGGAVTSLANPVAVGEELRLLLSNSYSYEQCSLAIKARVRSYYQEKDQVKAYNHLYGQLIEKKLSMAVG